MFTVNVNLNRIDKVKNFVNTVVQFDCDVDLGRGCHCIDAKSIMGIFSLDLSKDIPCTIHTTDENLQALYKERLADYIV